MENGIIVSWELIISYINHVMKLKNWQKAQLITLACDHLQLNNLFSFIIYSHIKRMKSYD